MSEPSGSPPQDEVSYFQYATSEAAFDACNVLSNPSHEWALAPGRLERQFAVVLATTGVEPVRMARWFVAWCALSSTWFEIDDDPGHAASAAALGERALALVTS